MIVVGILLIVLGLVLPVVHFLFWLGVVLVVCGAVMLALSYTRGGPRLY